MDPYKISEVEFDVLYADGTKKHVKNGILFEVIVRAGLNIMEQVAGFVERTEK